MGNAVQLISAMIDLKLKYLSEKSYIVNYFQILNSLGDKLYCIQENVHIRK